METNFFKQIADLNLTGNLQITIAKGSEGTQVVSVILLNEGCGDNAKNNIIPYNYRATPEELDNGFFKAIAEPMKSASDLMTNMEAFLKSMEVAKKNSAMEKPNIPKGKIEAKTDKYSALMAKVDALDNAGKPKDAWMLLQDLKAFPEHKEEILKRRRELFAKFPTDLFNSPQPEATPPTVEVDETETEDKVDEGYTEFIEEEETEESGY